MDVTKLMEAMFEVQLKSKVVNMTEAVINELQDVQLTEEEKRRLKLMISLAAAANMTAIQV